MSGDSADKPQKKRPTLDERPAGDRITRPSEPAMPLPPADDDSRVTLDYQDMPLSFAPDDGEDDLPLLELPPEADEDQSEPSAALSLVGSRPSHLSIDLRSEMHELFALDDFTAALSIAELLLGQDEVDEDALGVASECRRRLVQLYTSRIGDLQSVPSLAVPPGEIRWLGLDHRGGFLLSRVDGAHTVEELCDVSGMEKLEALKTLVELRDAGAIRIG